MSRRQKGNKVVIIGDSSVGKTCIIQQYINSTFQETTTTIGACHFQQTIKDIPIEIWDTAGQERFKSMIPMYYKGAKAIIIVFDVTNVHSFEGAKKWLNEIKTNIASCYKVLCGNKIDLKDQRSVSGNDAKTYADNNQCAYIETSAKDNVGIDEMFDNIADNIKKMKENEEANTNNNKSSNKGIIDINNQSNTTNNNNSCYSCY